MFFVALCLTAVAQTISAEDTEAIKESGKLFPVSRPNKKVHNLITLPLEPILFFVTKTLIKLQLHLIKKMQLRKN